MTPSNPFKRREQEVNIVIEESKFQTNNPEPSPQKVGITPPRLAPPLILPGSGERAWNIDTLLSEVVCLCQVVDMHWKFSLPCFV